MKAFGYLGLPVVALALVGGVLGIQVARGGTTYAPLRTADPCIERVVTTQAAGIEGLTERLVLLGIDGAACRLQVSREALTLDLAESQEPTDAEIDAMRAGLHDAVRRMKADGTLPPAADLVEEALDSIELNGLLERIIRALPDSVVNGALRTDDVLDRTIDSLDLRAVLANLDDTEDLERQVQAAVVPAVKDALVQRLKDLV